MRNIVFSMTRSTVGRIDVNDGVSALHIAAAAILW
jgi:hypothetical protein